MKPAILLLTLFLYFVSLAVGDSPVFSLMAVGDDLTSPVQLYPLTVKNNSLALSNDGTLLLFIIDENGLANVENSNYRLIIDSTGRLTANTSGTTIFYITGKHLHYNQNYVFVGCPEDTGNKTFAVYASTDTSICARGVVLNLRPVGNDTTAIDSYIPLVLQSGTYSQNGRSNAPSGTLGLGSAGTNLLLATGTRSRSTLPTLGQSSSLTLAPATSAAATTGSTTAGLTTASSSSSVATTASLDVYTETVVVDASLSFESTLANNGGAETITVEPEDNTITSTSSPTDQTVTVTQSATTSTISSCADAGCETVFIQITTIQGSHITLNVGATTSTSTLQTLTNLDTSVVPLNTLSGTNTLLNTRTDTLSNTLLPTSSSNFTRSLNESPQYLKRNPATFFLFMISFLLF